MMSPTVLVECNAKPVSCLTHTLIDMWCSTPQDMQTFSCVKLVESHFEHHLMICYCVFLTFPQKVSHINCTLSDIINLLIQIMNLSFYNMTNTPWVCELLEEKARGK